MFRKRSDIKDLVNFSNTGNRPTYTSFSLSMMTCLQMSRLFKADNSFESDEVT